MLARLQQAITIGLAALAVVWLVLVWRAGHPGWAVAGAAVLLFGHALFLGVEFVLLARVHGDDPAPRASAAQLLAAWWGESLAAPQVFCWRQPFRSALWPDYLPDHLPDHLPDGAAGRRGVLFIHGFVCNRGLWNPWLGKLRERGVPYVAVNLEPVFGSIDEYAAPIEQAVRALERCTGQAPIVVAHSMGGLALRRWYAEQSDAARIEHAITIGSPHHGTWLARMAFSRNGAQMRQRSRWLATLSGREDKTRRSRFTCFYGHCDNIVFPPSTATLPGADNRHLEGVAHVHMADHPAPWAELERRLTATR